jgi:rhodanese-related sulfurtransferase
MGPLLSASVVTVSKRATIDDVLAEVRTGLKRLDPLEAHEAQRAGALLVDIRPVHQREASGSIPGSVQIDLTVLEWRLDPAGEAALPLADLDAQIVVVCQEGYSSSLAAASLQRIGLHRATDLAGGVDAWVEQGLPVER